MTRDVAAQAVHERLESLVATMSEPDVEAGWAALVAQLEPPVAPVVPLRRKPRPRRAIVLGVAAAIFIGGSALAMVRHGGNDGPPAPVHPPSTAPGRVGLGPHVHPSLSGPRSTHTGRPPGSTGSRHQGVAGSTTGSTSSSDRSGGATSGSSGDHTTHPSHHDSPNDTDHGTGNDVHGDNGQGNNTQGQDGQGDGSTAGSGNDQGSGGGQGSSNRGTHATGDGEHPTGGGSDGGNGSSGQGQGGGQGSSGH
jgi:hypothetical protein